ncbi:MAG: DNA polymerase III subunit delta' [Bosea sp. (in: a-proteobacteria)]|jgi:DNA polymerase-3 subunit delta'
MSDDAGDEPDRLAGFAHPREATHLVGHHDAQAAILEGLRQGKLHHAWLIGGPEGIGKATFAYMVAKQLLGLKGGPAPTGDRLDVDPARQASRLVSNLAHPDLVVLRRQPATDKKAAATMIAVETVRRALDVFASTPSDGGWRVCVVDSADDLNASAANALLKVLEEPPARAIFLIIAHQPARVLPTIRSRCRKLALRPLAEAEITVVLDGLDVDADSATIRQAIALADGSVRRAISRLDPETAALIGGTRGLLARLPDMDIPGVLAMSDQLAGRAAEADFAVFMETIEDWVRQLLHANLAAGAHRLAPLAEVWDKTARAVRETDALNLDRRPLVLSIFQDLSEAVSRMRAA